MKFIKSKITTDHANELWKVNKKTRALLKELEALKARKQELEDYLIDKVGRDFEFNGDDDYLRKAEFKELSRVDVDLDKVRLFYEKHDRKVPTKKSEWVRVKLSYVEE